MTQCYGSLASVVGSAVTFWGFAGFSLAIFVFCVVFVPETKGRTLDEIQVSL